MHIHIITLFPEMFSTFSCGMIHRACSRQLLHLSYQNPRDYTNDKHKTVDDRPYGGGPGMLMKAEPLLKSINAIKKDSISRAHIVYLTPQGYLFNQATAKKLSQKPNLVLIAGHYEGIDERIIDLEVDEELSIGDYVLSGGEFAAMVIVDAIVRLLPGVLGNEASAQQDSLSQNLLEYPQYTRPACYQDCTVPEILLTGNHTAIQEWRLKQSLGRTWLRRPDLLAKRALTECEQILLTDFINAYRGKDNGS